MSVVPSPSNSITENSGELILDLLSVFENLSLTNREEISTTANLDKTSNTNNINIIKNISNPENNLNKISIMTPPNFDTKLFNIVPQFDGNPLELSAFLETANMLVNTYWDVTPANIACTQNVLLIYGIYAKLLGPAKEVYSTCISKDWANVKGALIAHFGDHRNESGLLTDLGLLRQGLNEPALQFLQKIMSNLNGLHNHIDTHTGDETSKIARKIFYNSHALNVFLSGLKEPLGSTIRAMRPTDLATARQFIISENNIRHLQKPHIQLPTKQRENPRFTHHNHSQNRHITPFYANQSTNQFPSQPININPRPVQPQRYFTNKQVFGNPPNVFKPKHSPQNNYPKPTPMSGISHGTRLSNKYPQYNRQSTNHFRNHGQNPNIHVEELFNVEPVSDESQIYENNYYDHDQEYYQDNYPYEQDTPCCSQA